MKKKVLINAANLHVGGGVQVAVSFIYEMTQMAGSDLSNIHIIASTAVNQGVLRLRADVSVFQSYEVVDLKGMRAFFSAVNRRVKKYDVVFTVFGPNYLRKRAKKEVVGFAQPWMLEFDNALTRKMGSIEKKKKKIKHLLQWALYKRADIVVVELEHVKKKLLALTSIKPECIKVVHNTVSSLYYNKAQWGGVVVEKKAADISLGVVSRDYNHKNLSVLPGLAEALFRNHNLVVHFYVTFNDAEWEARNEAFKRYVTNVGLLQPNECPSFYQQMDGVVFPSLLECFSATPLEAMVMKKPLFASDKDFVRDVCGDSAFYFDPLDIENMSDVIASYFCGGVDMKVHLDKANRKAANFSCARDRAIKYLEIINGL